MHINEFLSRVRDGTTIDSIREIALDPMKNQKRSGISITPEREATSDFRYGLIDLIHLYDLYEGEKHLLTDMVLTPPAVVGVFSDKTDYFEWSDYQYQKYLGYNVVPRGKGDVKIREECDVHLAGIWLKQCRHDLIEYEKNVPFVAATRRCNIIMNSQLINDDDPIHINAILMLANINIRNKKIYDAERLLNSILDLDLLPRMSNVQRARHEEAYAKLEELKIDSNYYGRSFGAYRRPLVHYVKSLEFLHGDKSVDLRMLIQSNIYRLNLKLNEYDEALKNELIAYLRSNSALVNVHVYKAIVFNLMGISSADRLSDITARDSGA